MPLRNIVTTMIVLCASSTVAIAQPGILLHDNGPFITGDGVEYCADAPSGSNTSYPSTGETGGIVSYWVNRRAIDDFNIPPGQSWSLEQLRWRAYQLDTLYDSEISTAFVRVWDSDPQLGGEPIWGDFESNRYVNTTFTGVFRTNPFELTSCRRAIKNVDIDLTDLPPLPPGHYWVEVGLGSELPGTLFSPPTEPRLPSDNGLMTDFSGIALPAIDGATTEPLDFPFQLYGETDAIPTNACLTGAGNCIDTTRNDCINTQGGTWNYFHTCAELGACCNHADGSCVENIGGEDCAAAGMIFRIGEGCEAIPNCGQSIGVCCYPNETPTTCQSFSTGLSCTSQGGFWHLGSCTGTDCNDYCETAKVVFDGETLFDTFGYDTDGPVTPNDCGNNPFIGRSDAWFRYTSTLTEPAGQIEFSLCQTTAFDSTLQIYKLGAETTCDDLQTTALATYCDNDGCGTVGGPSYLSIPANPGDELLIRIGGFDGAQGGGRIHITPIENGIGTCCSITTPCRVVDESECSFATEIFSSGVLCDNPGFECPPVGACCLGPLGCETNLEPLCLTAGGTFLGDGSDCVSPADCDGDGETDLCAIAIGAFDCNENGIPDSCDIAPGGDGSDCDGDFVPDSCQEPKYCCRGDVNGDTYLDGRDIQEFIAAMFEPPPFCFTREFCRRDVNGDFAFDLADMSAFVDTLIAGDDCPVLIHVSGQVNVLNDNDQVIGVANQVFVLDEEGELLYSYDQVGESLTDNWGYRDGASDGTHVYFGWLGGVARHDADGSNGIQIIFGPAPSTGGTWRALAFDPDGDNGNGSLWTQSFGSDLLETDLTGVLLHQYPNDLNLYGLAHDRDSGTLWGHHIGEPNFESFLVEIDRSTGQPTGASFPCHFDMPGGSLNGLAQYGGASFDPRTRTIYGLLQATPDALFRCDTAGNLTNTPVINPRDDMNLQTGTIRNLGVVVIRP